jgi:hypothetical protein
MLPIAVVFKHGNCAFIEKINPPLDDFLADHLDAIQKRRYLEEDNAPNYDSSSQIPRPGDKLPNPTAAPNHPVKNPTPLPGKPCGDSLLATNHWQHPVVQGESHEFNEERIRY